jgi:hypothetical protein
MKGNIFEVTADCGEYCGTEYYPNDLIRFQDDFSAYDLVNVDWVYYEIYNAIDQLLYYAWVHVTRDGIVPLWDLLTGINSFTPVCYYFVDIWLITCKGKIKGTFRVKLRVTDYSKSLNEESEEGETETQSPYLSPNIENTVSQNENASPVFSIIPNPNSGSFQLETNFPLTDIGKIKVINLLGNTIYEIQQVTSPTIQLPAVANGQLFVAMILKDGTVLTQKMVVQR